MTDLLQIDDLSAGYGDKLVVAGVSLTIGKGQTTVLLGRNGTGKSTLIKAIAGLATWMGGRIVIDGMDVSRLSAEARAAIGIGWVPQQDASGSQATVQEILIAAARPGPCGIDRVLDLFPRLAERRTTQGCNLSDGERKMLAISKALVFGPRVLLLDQPLDNLAPIIVDEIIAVLRRLAGEEGLAILMADHKVRTILPLADKALVLDRGSIVHVDSGVNTLANNRILQRHTGLAAGMPAALTVGW